MTLPPKPPSRPDRVPLWRYARLFRADILSAQPARLYRAWMAEFRTPFFRSYLCNDPELVEQVLYRRPQDFLKSSRVREGLAILIGQSIFLTDGAVWERQRRIIDPAFEGGRLRQNFPAIWAAGEAAIARIVPDRVLEVEEFMHHVAADVIFRTLFSIPIDDVIASRVYQAFRTFQRSQPLLNFAALIPLPAWFPRLYRPATRRSAATIRGLIRQLTESRAGALADGTAPDDLVSKIMRSTDPETGEQFSPEELVDQVTVFFLAGHETGAAGLAWALYLLASHPEVQDRVAAEVAGITPDFAIISRLRLTRDVFREALRLYPPVPMFVRETARAEVMRQRQIRPGAQIILSPWHLHRHEALWDRPDVFDPDRWQTEACRQSARDGYLPFSAGPRVCPGAGFAMLEGTLLLAQLVQAFRFDVVEGEVPVPISHMTIRAKHGIKLRVTRRDASSG